MLYIGISVGFIVLVIYLTILAVGLALWIMGMFLGGEEEGERVTIEERVGEVKNEQYSFGHVVFPFGRLMLFIS